MPRYLLLLLVLAASAVAGFHFREDVITALAAAYGWAAGKMEGTGLGAAVAAAIEAAASVYPWIIDQWPDAEDLIWLLITVTFVLFFAPAAVAMGAFTFFVLWPLGVEDFPAFLDGPLVVFGAVFSWVVWSTVGSRSLSFVGVWDPFSVAQRRRWILRGMVRIRDWWQAARRFGKGPTAEWAGFLEVISNRFNRNGDVFLGRPKLPIGGMLRPVGIPTEKHMVTIAGTGSGKSTAALIPNLCIHQGSALCIDPKGELASITASRRGPGGYGVDGMGQKVFILDPFDTVQGWPSSSYNVFDEMARVASVDPDRPVSYAGTVAEALIKTMNEKDSYWDNAAHTFLRGLILYIFAHEAPERRNLVRLRQLVMEGDAEAYHEAVEAGVIESGELDPFDVLLEQMKACRDEAYGEGIASAASSLLMMGANQRGGVITTAQEHTAFLDLPEIRRVSERSDFLLEDLKQNRISVYLCLPLNAVTGKEGRWLRMFVLLLIDMMMRVQKAPKPPILLAIDEFPSLGRLDGIEVVAPVLRSYGVRFWAIGQDIEQFEKTYPDSWGGFIGGAEAVQFMGITHPKTVNFLSKLLGTHVVRRRRTNSWGQRETVEDVQPLLDPDQVSRLLSKEKGNQIVWRGARRPMLLKTAPYYDYMPWYYYDDDPRYKEKWRRRWWRYWTTEIQWWKEDRRKEKKGKRGRRFAAEGVQGMWPRVRSVVRRVGKKAGRFGRTGFTRIQDSLDRIGIALERRKRRR